MIADQVISTPELETPSEDSNPDTTDSQPDVIADQVISTTSQLNSSTEELNPRIIDSKPRKTMEPEINSSEIESPSEDSNDL